MVWSPHVSSLVEIEGILTNLEIHFFVSLVETVVHVEDSQQSWRFFTSVVIAAGCLKILLHTADVALPTIHYIVVVVGKFAVGARENCVNFASIYNFVMNLSRFPRRARPIESGVE